MTVIQGRCLLGDELVASELIIKSGLIDAINPVKDNHDLPIISPGFIDLQVNGAADRLLNATPDRDAILHINQALQRLGTTAWLPTVVTDSLEVMGSLANAVASLRSSTASILGVHFEGPHINPVKKGVHNEVFIRASTSAELAIYGRDDLGCRLLTLAPETISSDELTKLHSLGCILAIGHSNANYEQAADALASGVSACTHLFNAMTGAQSREPGVVGAVLDSDIAYGLILDGEHVHPTMARQAFRMNSNMCLVTDAMPLLASDKTQFEWFGNTITKQAKRLTDNSGRLAGACISQLDALHNALEYLQIKLPEALQLVTRNPAKLLGLYPHYGAITTGSRADLVALDASANLLNVWVGGESVALT